MAGSTHPLHGFALLRTGLYLMTAAHDDVLAGVIVRSVQPCSEDPPLLCVAVRTGHPIEPIIRDARCFAVCRLDDSDKLALRKFASDVPLDEQNQFDAIPTQRLATGAPVLRRSPLVFDCEVVRHFDLEAESELYIGHVVACRVAAGYGIAHETV
ncbi:MAG: flavin reductase family protein [Planctomycetota bacterium]|nr:flavin reductase family protein [Planctomycetota bacterium]